MDDCKDVQQIPPTTEYQRVHGQGNLYFLLETDSEVKPFRNKQWIYFTGDVRYDDVRQDAVLEFYEVGII